MPVATSRRQQYLTLVKARLEAITAAGGLFATDAGDSVHLGEVPAFGPDDPRQAIVVMVGDDEVGRSDSGKVFVTLPLSIWAIVAADVDLSACYMDAEAVLADIKRAMELVDRTFGGLVAYTGISRGLTQTLRREPGSEFVGVAIEYRAEIHEAWGAP